MGIDRIIPAAFDRVHRADDRQLAESVVEVIVAADDVRHAHIVIVDHHRQHIGRRAVRTQQDIVIDLGILHRHPALNRIFDHGFAFLRRFQPDDERCASGRFRRVAVAPAAVVTQWLLGGALGRAHLFQFFGRGVAAIGVACIEQLLRHFGMARFAGRLEHGFTVPIESQPVEPGNDRVDGCLSRTGTVGVFDPEQRLAAMVAGIEPVEQGGAGATNVEKTRRRRGEAGDDGFVACACHETPFPFLSFNDRSGSLRSACRR